MAGKARSDRVGEVIKEVEALAKRLRTDIQKRVKAGGLLKGLQTAAGRLRKSAAVAAAHVEKYVHEIRKELEGGSKPVRRAATKRRKRAPKPAPAPVA
ncbi:MAG: hypothetical protein HY269_03495 [Deltaproteobacteria bacterium]|nr:hypothetical protein [Deltaproteobacteria bacterium]